MVEKLRAGRVQYGRGTVPLFTSLDIDICFSAMATGKLFTLGYEQRSIEEFVDLLAAARIDVLLDVRETAWSHKPGFSKTPLSIAVEKVGIEYNHIHWAGNPKWLRSVADSHAECLDFYREYVESMEGLVESFVDVIEADLSSGKNVCLTCYERHPGDCHRGILVEQWVARGGSGVEHLAPEGRPRLVKIA